MAAHSTNALLGMAVASPPSAGAPAMLLRIGKTVGQPSSLSEGLCLLPSSADALGLDLGPTRPLAVPEPSAALARLRPVKIIPRIFHFSLAWQSFLVYR